MAVLAAMESMTLTVMKDQNAAPARPPRLLEEMTPTVSELSVGTTISCHASGAVTPSSIRVASARARVAASPMRRPPAVRSNFSVLNTVRLERK